METPNIEEKRQRGRPKGSKTKNPKLPKEPDAPKIGRPKKIDISKPEYLKQWREKNKEHIKEYYKNYLESHSPLEKIHCDICNLDINKASISRHRKTKNHIIKERLSFMQASLLEQQETIKE